jgi:hypothetical protein
LGAEVIEPARGLSRGLSGKGLSGKCDIAVVYSHGTISGVVASEILCEA